jgi:hypothetical protein
MTYVSTQAHICNNFWTVSLVSTLFLVTNAQYPHFSTGSAIQVYPQCCLSQDQTDIHTVPLITPNPYCSKASAKYADCSTYQSHCSAYQTNIHTVPQDQPHLQSFFTESALKSTLFHRISPIYVQCSRGSLQCPNCSTASPIYVHTIPQNHSNIHTQDPTIFTLFHSTQQDIHSVSRRI